jgi:hypothetical protein
MVDERRMLSPMRSRAVALFAACAVSAACGSQSPPESARPGKTRLEFAPLSAEIVSPYYGGLEKPVQRVVASREEWEQLWREIEPRTSREQGQTAPNPVPDIDFDRYALVVAAMGTRPTGGYTVAVVSLEESEQRIVITVEEKSAGAKCTTTQAVTHPIAIVTTAKTQKRFEFETVRTIQECS